MRRVRKDSFKFIKFIKNRIIARIILGELFFYPIINYKYLFIDVT